MLKVAVFGVGHLGKFHLNNWQNIQEIKLVGFYDIDDEAAEAVEKQYNIKRFTSIDKLIDAADIVDVVVPTQFHFDICKQAIRKGKHVFVEKPITQTVEQAKELVAMVKEAGIKLQVGHVERFNPAFSAIKNKTFQPMFIEVHRLSQFNPRGTEVSVILDLMIHDIDIILSLVKSDVKSIYASGVAVMTDTPDIANVRIEFNNGCVANLTASRISMKKMRKMRLFQKDAYIAVDFLEKKSEVISIKKEDDDNAFCFDLETNNGTKTIAVSSPEIDGNVNAIYEELNSFVQAIINDTDTEVSEWDGFLAVDIAQQILQKISSVKTIVEA